jgi:hypothetical protein
MVVKITNANSGNVQELSGDPEQIRNQILVLWPWTKRSTVNPKHDPNDIMDVLARLGGAQDIFVEVT